jgi:predicted site-specific integrase-resolvase
MSPLTEAKACGACQTAVPAQRVLLEREKCWAHVGDMRVAIHARLSSDPTGQQTATERQRRACEQFAAARGWDVVRVIEDVDVSAYDAKVRRPGFERLRGLIDRRAIDVVMVWKLDRLVRRPREFEHPPVSRTVRVWGVGGGRRRRRSSAL